MKRLIALTSLLFAFISVITYPLLSKSVIKKNHSSTNPGAGHVKKIEFQAAAHDKSGDYIFKAPRSVTLLDNGSFLVVDNSQVLRFGTDGMFLSIMVKKGQGPGEATHISQVFKRKNDIIVTACFMNKLMVFGFDGQLKKEHKLSGLVKSKRNTILTKSFKIMGSTPGGELLVYSLGSAMKDGNPDTKKLDNPMYILDKSMKWQKLPTVLPVDAKIFEIPGRKIFLNKFDITYAANHRYVFISNTERYQIKLFDVRKLEMTGTWKRDYPPVKIPSKEREKYRFGPSFTLGIKGKRYSFEIPPREDFLDVQRIFPVGDELWVITSTVDNSKGVLVDVFDQEGNNADHFYLMLPPGVDGNALYANRIHLDKNTLLIRQRDDEDNYRIVKYSIE